MVDDNLDHTQLLAELLTLRGYEVVTAFGAELGLAALRARTFAVVITDQNMPGRTGSSMLDEAKATGLLENTSALVVTSAPDDVVGWRALSKMVDVDVLLAELKTLAELATVGQ